MIARISSQLLLMLMLSGSAIAAGKPNILLIYTDDHGWADLGAQGVDKDVRTPHLDQLVRGGVRCSRGYVSAPQCVPSRAGVITGRYQQRFGVEDNSRGPLPLAELTIAERLKQAGYITGMSGKWHLDIGGEKGGGKGVRLQRDHMPDAQGFDEYWRGEMKQYYASHDLGGHRFPDAPHPVADNRFRVVVQTEAALAFLDRRAAKPEQPWFFYLAWFAPHVPLESPEPWFSKTPAQLPLKRRQALAMIAAMDDGLGRIRQKLQTMGVEKDTLIFVIGDNGAPLGEAWDGSINLPMRGQKGMLSEGGIRTPFVVAWPGHIPAGQTYDHPVISLDVAATAVALAGLPADNKLDGVNLLPFLTGENKTAPHETLYWRWRSQAAVQEFPYKLISLGSAHDSLLFDVTTPEGEAAARNLIKTKPEIAARLQSKLNAWVGTLQPLATPDAFDKRHEDLFAEHDLIPGRAVSSNAPGPTTDGWSCRSGTIAIRDGALVIAPASGARTFLTRAGLDIPGPVTLAMRVRATLGGPGMVAWRMKKQADFIPASTVNFEWPAAADWREVKVQLPVEGRLFHVRIIPPKGGSGLEIQSIELRGSAGAPGVWRFQTESES